MDVFAALKKPLVLFGGLPEQTFVYALVAGVPAQMKQLLRTSTSIEATPIKQLLEYAQAIIRDEAELGEPVAIAAPTAQSGHTIPRGWIHGPE